MKDFPYALIVVTLSISVIMHWHSVAAWSSTAWVLPVTGQLPHFPVVFSLAVARER